MSLLKTPDAGGMKSKSPDHSIVVAPQKSPVASDDPRWVVVELEPVRALQTPVSLQQIKAEPALADLALVRRSRLSVTPVSRRHFDKVLRLGETRL